MTPKCRKTPILTEQPNEYFENFFLNKKQFTYSMQSEQKPRDILHRNRQNNPKVQREAQKTPDCQSNPEQKEQYQRDYYMGFQVLLQNQSNENNIVLVQKQVYTSKEQSRRLNVSHLILDKIAKITTRGMIMKKLGVQKLVPYLLFYIKKRKKITSKHIKDLNEKPATSLQKIDSTNQIKMQERTF